MSAYVLLNLLIKLVYVRLAEHFISFRNKFDIFNNTGARLSYDIKIILKSYFRHENVRVCHMRDVSSVIS